LKQRFTYQIRKQKLAVHKFSILSKFWVKETLRIKNKPAELWSVSTRYIVRTCIARARKSHHFGSKGYEDTAYNHVD